MMEIIENILPIGLRSYIREQAVMLNNKEDMYSGVEEIRLRAGKPVIFHRGCDLGQWETEYIVSIRDLEESMEYITGFSLYAYESEVKEGYVTIRGGHRVGIAGKVITVDGRITTISPISSINIRVSHQVIGCARAVMSYVMDEDKYCNTLIVSPPGAGKTTLLRDMIRLLSDEYKLKVSVVDERSEIASCYKGVTQCDVGIRSDIYDCCHKKDGVMLMIRAMSPQIVAVDELGGVGDMEAMYEAIRCGCKVLATAHGQSVKDVWERLGKDLCDGVFERYIVLSSDGVRRMAVYDRRSERIC